MTVPFPLTDDEVYTFLDRAMMQMISRTDLDIGPGERGRMYAWYWGYYGRAAVDFYIVTGEERFAQLIVRTAESLLELRDDSLNLVDDERGVVFPSWGTRYKTGERSNEITTAGLIALPMIEYARVSNSYWLADAAAEALVAFKEEREITANGEHYFVHRTDNVVEALNHVSVYGAALAHATTVFDDPWFRDTACGIYRYFRRFARFNDGMLAWPYAPSPSDVAETLPSEAVWKAAATIELPIAMIETGLSSDRTVIDGIASSIVENPLLKRGKFSQFIGTDRLVEVDPGKVSGSLTSFIGAFLQVDRSDLREVLFTLMTEQPHLFPNGWKGGSRAMIMAWANMRRRGAVAAP